MLTYPRAPKLLVLTGPFPPLLFPQQQIVKKTISFFHLTHCYPSAVYCLSAGCPPAAALRWESGGEGLS